MGSIVTSSAEVMEALGIESPTSIQCGVVDREIVHAEGLIKRYLRYDPVYKAATEYYPRGHYMSLAGGEWEITDTHAYISRDGSASADQLQLQRIPIRSISVLRVNEDGRSGTRPFNSEHTLTEGDDFWANYDLEDSSGTRICHDGILRSVGRWPSQPGSVRVSYYAGYTASEFTGQSGVLDATPIYAAIVNESIRRAKNIFLQAFNPRAGFIAGNIASERLGDYFYSLGGNVARTATDRLYGGYNSLMPETKEILADFVNYGIYD